MAVLTNAGATRAGQYVRCAGCGQRVARASDFSRHGNRARGAGTGIGRLTALHGIGAGQNIRGSLAQGDPSPASDSRKEWGLVSKRCLSPREGRC